VAKRGSQYPFDDGFMPGDKSENFTDQTIDEPDKTKKNTNFQNILKILNI